VRDLAHDSLCDVICAASHASDRRYILHGSAKRCTGWECWGTQRPQGKGVILLVALAGDHAQTEREGWREIATQLYAWGLAGISVLLLFLFPPKFDLRVSTLIQIALVAAFLAAMERPVRTPASNVAPLTALMAACGVVFGAWMIVLAILSGFALQLRLVRSETGKWAKIIGLKTLMQVATAIIASYAVLGTWGAAGKVIPRLPHGLASLFVFIAIILVGLAWQMANILFVDMYRLINGKPFVLPQLLRIGIVASVYAYLLVATYNFGGLLATAVFYIVVAQIKVLQDILGITTQLHKLERAQDQAQGLVRDLVRFTDTEDVEFSSEVQNISQMLGRRIGMSKADVEALSLAAQLHEMGKSRLPARIRSGKDLNARELAQRGTYSRWGGLMVRASDALLPTRLADWIEFHSEHFDGTGYPRGLHGEDIPMPSRIIAIARDYVRYLTGYDGVEKVGKEKALTLLREGSGTLYDPRLVTLLNELVS
jgi:HD domain